MTVMCSKVDYIRETHHILGSKLMLGHARGTFIQAASIFHTDESKQKARGAPFLEDENLYASNKPFTFSAGAK